MKNINTLILSFIAILFKLQLFLFKIACISQRAILTDKTTLISDYLASILLWASKSSFRTSYGCFVLQIPISHPTQAIVV